MSARHWVFGFSVICTSVLSACGGGSGTNSAQASMCSASCRSRCPLYAATCDNACSLPSPDAVSCVSNASSCGAVAECLPMTDAGMSHPSGPTVCAGPGQACSVPSQCGDWLCTCTGSELAIPLRECDITGVCMANDRASVECSNHCAGSTYTVAPDPLSMCSNP